jgi:hypothetical protein
VLAAADSCRRDIPAQIGGVAPPSDTDHLPPGRARPHKGKSDSEAIVLTDGIDAQAHQEQQLL